jgi:hypothetical protein
MSKRKSSPISAVDVPAKKMRESISEITPPDKPCRLYLDIYSVLYGGPSPTVARRAWLRGFLAIVQKQLEKRGASAADAANVLVTNDSRLIAKGWETSYHLTWPDVPFADTHTAMKAFVVERIAPALRHKPAYQWLVDWNKPAIAKQPPYTGRPRKSRPAEDYNCGPTFKSVLDESVYSHHHIPRVSSAPTPWDVENWCPLVQD